MRAAIFSSPGEKLSIQTLDAPRAGKGELVLKVRNCGICGSDLHMTEAHTIQPLPAGSIMGHEFSGEIVEVGAGLSGRFREGQRVAGFPFMCCGQQSACPNFSGAKIACTNGRGIGLGTSPGAYAEFVTIGGHGAHFLPDIVSFEEGALVEPLAVGLHAVDMARMNRGDTVLVIGAGPVGLAVALWARFLGARHVIVSEKAETRRVMAAKMGATDVIDPAKALTPQVEAIAGAPPDIIFECVGVPGLLNEIFMAAPRGCKVVVAGVCQQPDTIFPLIGIVKELNVQFVFGYRPADFDYVIEMIAKDRIDAGAMVTDRISLDQLPDAFEALRKPSTQCKVMVGF
ncbi:MAG TPA: alcohol dehydrogenase catalytic domain-containing protein [Micropepsaceae bacterium]|nr:alcohol dehydrogenase catalytic domain-containing protein [Micropepsaceae bacterium]